jgi:hypothetical protein
MFAASPATIAPVLAVSAGAVILAEAVAMLSGVVLPVAAVSVVLVSELQAFRVNKQAANRGRVRRFIKGEV